jgi:hypothetical protein
MRVRCRIRDESQDLGVEKRRLRQNSYVQTLIPNSKALNTKKEK